MKSAILPAARRALALPAVTIEIIDHGSDDRGPGPGRRDTMQREAGRAEPVIHHETRQQRRARERAAAKAGGDRMQGEKNG
ncbi:hypothetical protein ACEUZ9_005482 [Paracoccus litorisediminis]|uniref:hypothetical protein n=1 Tax=Paracoccus litorisediminis TaxID=2006130 RepID=UPI00372F5176